MAGDCKEFEDVRKELDRLLSDKRPKPLDDLLFQDQCWIFEELKTAMKIRRIEKQSLSPLRLKCKKGTLLARWTDGLFYFVRITRVSETNKTCAVEFEDKSVATVHFKDLLEEKEEDVTMCHCCGRKEGEHSNVLVTCDNCGRDYHQACHVPPISLSGHQDDKFICRICVFTSCAQAGGAKKSGPLAAKFAEMKQHFPYDIKYLTWNATHTSNVEQCFCYCGGPGIWYNKMLQCCRCKQWFHEACMQCLDQELLIGDRFFVFACAHCNYGIEFIHRMDLTWFDISYVTLFHLIMTVGKRYMDLDSDIVPFIVRGAQSFGLKKLLNGLHGSYEAVSKEVVKVMHKHSNLFCCGSEVKKRCTFYGIRERIPPSPLPVSVPALDEVITSETLTSSYGKKVTFTASKFTLQVPYVMRGSNKVVPPTMGARIRESKLAKIARVKSEHNYCTPVKCLDESPTRRHSKDNNSWETFDANNNSPSTHHHQLKIELKIKEEIDTSINGRADSEIISDASSPETQRRTTFWSLDTAFPEPSTFTGANHPFLTEFEQDSLQKQRNHFEEKLRVLPTFLLEDRAKRDIGKPFISPPPSSAIRDVKGFKGELAELINSTCGPDFSSPKKPKCSTLEAELPLREEKLLNKLTSPKAGVLSPRNCFSSLESKKQGPRSYYISGVKISPKIGRKHLKNGFTCNKPEPSTSGDGRHEDTLDKVAQKRLKALNRCLKNLTPTCGFKFPVLEESHPAVSTSLVVPVTCSGLESKKLPCSSSSAAGLSDANSRSNSGSLLNSGKKCRKRKHEAAEYSRNISSKDKSASNAENVRRSHRSRSIVQRFEAASCRKGYDLGEKMGSAGNGLVGSDQYDVVSLRTVPGSNIVEYLICWS